jgi:hypothetical protein
MSHDIESELQYFSFDSASEVRALNICIDVQCAG